ncbi:MAG: VanZ family protein [Pirellulales bacterium]
MPPRIKKNTHIPIVDSSNHRGRQMLRVVFIVGFILYSVFLVVATHLPRIPTITQWPGVDKWLHFSAYGCQTVLAMGVLYFTKGLVLKNVALLIVVLTAFGAVDELTQPMFHRQAELLDWLADCAGVVFGVCSVWMFYSIREKSNHLREDSCDP